MEPGLMVLSIYCAHMAPKWNSLLELRPRQGKTMSVQAYCDEFCVWKKKMEEQNYLADEQSYVDDFLYGLKWDLAVKVWSYESKPEKLYDAFYRARFEESMIGIKAYLDKWNITPNASESISPVADQLQAFNDSDSGSETIAENPDDEVLEVNELSDSEEIPDSEENMGSESTIKHSSIDDESKLNEMLLPILVRKDEGIERNNGNVRNEGNVDEEGVVFPLIDRQSVLGSLGDTNVRGSSKGSTKAWFEELTSGLKVVLSQSAIGDVAHKAFDEVLQSIRAVLMDEYVINPYTNGFNFNNLTMFDPGGDRKYALSLSGGIVRPLIGKAQGTCVNGMKGAVSSLRHALSTIVSRDKYCIIAFNHFHIISVGSHAIFDLIVDSNAHGDIFTEMELKALFGKANSELLMKMFSFDPGGCSWSHIGCDTFEFDGKYEDYCLATIMADAGVQAVTHKIWIIIASFCGVIFLIDRAFFKNGLDTLIEIGTGRMGYHVDEFFVDYSFPNKTIKENTLWLEELGVDIAVVVVKNVTKEKRIVEASVLNKMISSARIGVLVPTSISILRNSLFDLLHNMDTTSGVVMTLGVLIILKGAKVHWFLSPHPKDVRSTSLHISPSLEVAYEEMERALTWVSNKVDKGFKMRKGFMLTKSQSATWIQSLKHCNLLTWKQIQEFPKELLLGAQQIVVRFENSTSIVLMSLGVGASHTNVYVQFDPMSRKAVPLVIFMCEYSWGIIDKTEAVEHQKPFSFVIAYFTYMPISNIREVCFEGWEPLHLLDNHSHREHSNGLGNVLIFEFEADRVYHSSWDMIASLDHGNTEKNRVVVSLCRLLEGQEGILGLSEVSSNCTTYVKLFPLHLQTMGSFMFVWDPDVCVIFVYILEDKDVLKRKGIRVRLALKQDEGRNGAFTYYNAHSEFSACPLIDRDSLMLFIILLLFVTFISTNGLQENGYVQTTLFELGYIDVTISHTEMLMTSNLLHFRKRCRDSRKALVFALGIDMENFVWNPSIVCFRLTTLRARWLSRGRICHDITFYYNFYVFSNLRIWRLMMSVI